MNISFIGAGNVALNLGQLFTDAGHAVKYSSRNPKEDQVSVAEACAFGEVVCLAIPFSAMEEVLSTHREALKGKVVVDLTNPINIENWEPLFLGEDSAGERAARFLPDSKVVKAFNHIFADVMKPAKMEFNGHKITAFIASDDDETAVLVKQLAEDAGFDGFIAGKIKNARYLEAMANLNIAMALAGGGTDAGFIYFQRKAY